KRFIFALQLQSLRKLREISTHLFLSVQSGLNSLGEISGFSNSPEMQKDHSWLFLCHVVMNSHDVNISFAKRFKNILKLIFIHCKITINDCFVICSSKRGPCIHSHSSAHFLP